MLEKLVEKLQSWAKTAPDVFDPSRFDDPVASQTEWTPAKGGGASFRTHKIVQVDVNRLEFRGSLGAKVFYSIFFFAGLGLLAGFSIEKISSGEFPLNADTIIPLLMGFLFAIIGGCMFYFGTAPIVFDKYKRAFWKGRKTPEDIYNKNSLKYFTTLENIHALQLISEYCRGNKSSYYSYELNLVLKNGNRINVVDHGNPAKLREDTQILSTFLNKPIWDAISLNRGS
jgi:hypothetical protein